MRRRLRQQRQHRGPVEHAQVRALSQRAHEPVRARAAPCAAAGAPTPAPHRRRRAGRAGRRGSPRRARRARGRPARAASATPGSCRRRAGGRRPRRRGRRLPAVGVREDLEREQAAAQAAAPLAGTVPFAVARPCRNRSRSATSVAEASTPVPSGRHRQWQTTPPCGHGPLTRTPQRAPRRRAPAAPRPRARRPRRSGGPRAGSRTPRPRAGGGEHAVVGTPLIRSARSATTHSSASTVRRWKTRDAPGRRPARRSSRAPPGRARSRRSRAPPARRRRAAAPARRRRGTPRSAHPSCPAARPRGTAGARSGLGAIRCVIRAADMLANGTSASRRPSSASAQVAAWNPP